MFLSPPLAWVLVISYVLLTIEFGVLPVKCELSSQEVDVLLDELSIPWTL
jgi:hypothetical protein